MKKTMKRYLSLLLAFLMLVSTFGMSVSAACNHEISTGDPKYQKVVNPTCTEQGYTVYYCTKCSNLETGAMVEVSRGDYKNSLGHKYGEDVYLPVSENDSSSYRKHNFCERQYVKDGNIVTCGNDYIEHNALNSQEVVYYLVTFINNKVTASYDVTIDYTDVAATFKEKEVYSCYVKAGDEAVYEGSLLSREKTTEFAKYMHLGWTEKKDLEAKYNDNLDESDVISLTNIQKNMTLYPVFEGLTSTESGIITHEVLFYILDKNNKLVHGTFPQEVAHRNFPKYGNDQGLYDDPVKQPDLVNTYEFAGWATKLSAESGIMTKDIVKTPIYGDVSFLPTFSATAKNYTVEFYDYTGKNILKYTSGDQKVDAVFDGINLETNLLSNEGINNLNKDKDAIKKDSDKQYYYEWTGKWAILNEDGTQGSTVDLSRLIIGKNDYKVAKDAEGNVLKVDKNGKEDPNGTEDKKVIKLVPVYQRSLQLYAVDIIMDIPSGEDSDYYRGDADVNVIANNGQLVASGVTDADGKFRCYLYYQTPFTVTIATQDEKYYGEAQINFLQKAVNQDTEAHINRCLVSMTINPDYETHCTCIHHNALLQPIWVRILNILYSFFNVKYVCCYDMYSTIGPLLDYTA